MSLPGNFSSSKYMRGACAIALMGLVFFLIGLAVFSNLSSDHNKEFHSGILTIIAHVSLSFLLMSLGLLFFLFGLVSGPLKSTSKPKKAKSLAGKAKLLLVTALFIYAFFIPHDWDWKKLKDYFSGTVYVTFSQDGYLIERIGHYNFEPLFFNYKPSWLGNTKKQFLFLDNDQYKLTLEALDSFGKEGVSVLDQGLHINKLGHYLFKISVTKSESSQYNIKRHYSDEHQLVYLSSRRNPDQWMPLVDDLPSNLLQKTTILEKYLVTDRAGGLTKSGNTYFLNKSFSFHSRESGSTFVSGYYRIAVGSGLTTSRWSSMPSDMYHNVIHSHHGLIYSFGGLEHGINQRFPDNWVYYPEEDKWLKLSPTPIPSEMENKYSPNIASVYTANDKLYVLISGHKNKYALYQFDLDANNAVNQWKLMKQFSLPSKLENWRYLDDNTLYAYKVIDRVKGYIQTLDLTTFKVKTISLLPSVEYVPKPSSPLSPESYVLRIINHNNKLYANYARKFYQILSTE